MKKRWILIPVAVLAVFSAAFFFSWPILTGKTTPPEAARHLALRAIEDARAHGADSWAAERFREAETRLAEALTEYRTQEVRFLPMRDFAAAESVFVLAEAIAHEAAEGAVSSKESARGSARQSVSRAKISVDASSALAATIHLSREERSLLNRSRLFLSRAEDRQRDGHYDEARQLAEKAAVWAEDLGTRCAERAARYTQGPLVRSWRRMVQETIEWSRRTGKTAIVVTKANHRLMIYRGGVVRATYPCDIGYNNVSDKLRSGDGATPEGKYTVVQKKGRGQSKYYKALLIDYPNSLDKKELQEAKRKGLVPRNATPGGLIEIHGDGGRGNDWTQGCVAVSNDLMDKIFDAAEVGTPVTIVGSDGDGGVFQELVLRFQEARRARGG